MVVPRGAGSSTTLLDSPMSYIRICTGSSTILLYSTMTHTAWSYDIHTNMVVQRGAGSSTTLLYGPTRCPVLPNPGAAYGATEMLGGSRMLLRRER
eukprot:1795288-Rhodomonas_salina.1